jgi:hypothetical protein
VNLSDEISEGNKSRAVICEPLPQSPQQSCSEDSERNLFEDEQARAAPAGNQHRIRIPMDEQHVGR